MEHIRRVRLKARPYFAHVLVAACSIVATSVIVSYAATASDDSGTYEFSEAPEHIGEKATITGTVVRVSTSKNGATFLDYCAGTGDCPFSEVVFASDAAVFGDMTKYQANISVTGVIKSYQGKAEMVLDDPAQVQVIK